MSLGSLSRPASNSLFDQPCVGTPGWTRRAKWRIRLVRVMAGSVDDFPILTIQDPVDVQGVMVYDCRPPLLPVSLQLCDLGPLSVRPTVASASVAVPPWEDGPTIGCGSFSGAWRCSTG